MVFIHHGGTGLEDIGAHGQLLCRRMHLGVVTAAASARRELTKNEGNIIVDPKGLFHFIVELYHLAGPRTLTTVGLPLMEDDARETRVFRVLHRVDLVENHLMV